RTARNALGRPLLRPNTRQPILGLSGTASATCRPPPLSLGSIPRLAFRSMKQSPRDVGNAYLSVRVKRRLRPFTRGRPHQLDARRKVRSEVRLLPRSFRDSFFITNTTTGASAGGTRSGTTN